MAPLQRAELEKFGVKQLKVHAAKRNVPLTQIASAVEKNDLIALILAAPPILDQYEVGAAIKVHSAESLLYNRNNKSLGRSSSASSRSRSRSNGKKKGKKQKKKKKDRSRSGKRKSRSRKRSRSRKKSPSKAIKVGFMPSSQVHAEPPRLMIAAFAEGTVVDLDFSESDDEPEIMGTVAASIPAITPDVDLVIVTAVKPAPHLEKIPHKAPENLAFLPKTNSLEQKCYSSSVLADASPEAKQTGGGGHSQHPGATPDEPTAIRPDLAQAGMAAAAALGFDVIGPERSASGLQAPPLPPMLGLRPSFKPSMRATTGSSSLLGRVCVEYLCRSQCQHGDRCPEAHIVDPEEEMKVRARFKEQECNFGPTCSRHMCLFRHPGEKIEEGHAAQFVHS